MKYCDIIQTEGRRFKKKIKYIVDEIETILDIDDFVRAKLKFNASIVGTVMKSLELETKTPVKGEIYLEITAFLDSENTDTRIYGPYYLKEEPVYNADSKTYTHICYDKFVHTMTDYKPITIEYPTNVLDFFKQLCIENNLTTDIEELPNGKRIINSDIFDGIGFTNRDVFDDIGQATGTLFMIEGNVVKKCEFNSNDIAKINDDILRNQNISFGNHFGPINSIVLSRSADSDFIYKRDESLDHWNEFKIQDNQLMNDNNRSDYLDELYDKLSGIEYDIYDTELTGYGGFNPLQKIEFTTGNNIYNSFAFNNEIEFTTGYKETIYTEMPVGSITDYKVSNNTDKGLKQAYLIVNKKLNEIEASVTKTEKTVNELSDLIKDFNVELDINNLLIPVDEKNKPIETTDYIINHNENFKGAQIKVKPTLVKEISGITVGLTDETIRISVSSANAIENLTNELELIFIYKDGETPYSITKKLMVILAPKGEQGIPGINGTNGTNGTNGVSSYTHIKYSEDGETFTPADDEYELGERPSAYIGMYVDSIATDSTRFNDYTWYKFSGDIDGTLLDLQKQINDNATKANNNIQDLNKKLEDKADSSAITELRESVNDVITSNSRTTTIVEEILQNGVSQVKTETNFTFNKDGLNLDKTGANTGSKLNEAGFEVKDKTGSTEETLSYNGFVNDEMAKKSELLKKFLGTTVNYARNSLIEQWLSFKNWRLEEVDDSIFGNGIGFFKTGD